MEAPGTQDAQRIAAGLRPLLDAGAIADKEALHEAKRRLMRTQGVAAMPTDRAISEALGEDDRKRWAGILRTKPTRTLSGVAVVAVMSSPASCPHGKCSFCPGGPDVDAPQSYTGFEPSTLRARRHQYDPYRIVRERLTQLARNGHEVSKVDIVIQGGTFPAREPAYQDWFVAGLYAGLNDGPYEESQREDGVANPLGTESDWVTLPPAARSKRLHELQLRNEGAACRCIGLTLETKPDWCFEPHVERMLAYGATRVEIGLQALDDGVLEATHRGHTLADSARSLQVARDAGLKVCVHMMPGLPRARPKGSVGAWGGDLDPDPEADVEDMRRLFAEPAWRPDMLKIYPTLVVEEGETLLKRQFRDGRFHPYDTAAAAEVVARSKPFVPEWCRIQRVDRDIPTTHVVGGVMNSNLRQIAQAEMARRGLPPCRCLRCREAGRRAEGPVPVDATRLRLVRRDVEASGATEVFLAFEDPEADAVAGFLRLRLAGTTFRPETQVPGGAAFVRELKVFGLAKAVGDDDPEAGAFQHQGLGAKLLAEAERIAFGEHGVGRILVTAGVGVKAYYRRHGYVDCGAYVGKDARRRGTRGWPPPPADAQVSGSIC